MNQTSTLAEPPPLCIDFTPSAARSSPPTPPPPCKTPCKTPGRQRGRSSSNDRAQPIRHRRSSPGTWCRRSRLAPPARLLARPAAACSLSRLAAAYRHALVARPARSAPPPPPRCPPPPVHSWSRDTRRLFTAIDAVPSPASASSERQPPERRCEHTSACGGCSGGCIGGCSGGCIGGCSGDLSGAWLCISSAERRTCASAHLRQGWAGKPGKGAIGQCA